MTIKQMRITAFAISLILCTVSALGMFRMGWTWIYDGFGLHPFISLPGGMMALALPFVALWTIIDEE
jgi:hypothetical protein